MRNKSPLLVRLDRMADKVARVAALESVRLKESRIFNGIDLGEKAEILPRYSLNVQLRLAKDAPRFALTVELNSGGYKTTDSRGNPTAFQLVPKFELVYVFPKNARLNERAIKAFAQFRAPVDAWPFFREYIQTTMSRMGLPGFALDPFDPAKFWKLGEGNGAEPRSKRPKSRSRR